MQFLDLAKIYVRSGSGGHGAVSFRREKFVEFGGPDGGNGGNGGDVIVRAVDNLNTLIGFKYRRHYFAENGKNGMGRQKQGAKGKNIVIEVPQGTEILDETQSVQLFDLIELDKEITLAPGGNGGFGNYHFKSSTNRTPRVANQGQPGTELAVILRLKILADVGLAGLPNSGKSTFLSKVSRARPKIGDYPFTTLRPQLGTVVRQGIEITIADIPGIIEGSTRGRGLGIRFLGHIERCSCLLHLIDSSNPDPVQDFRVVNQELHNQGTGLESKPRIIALNKTDLVDRQIGQELMHELQKICNHPVLAISTMAEVGLDDCVDELIRSVERVRRQKQDRGEEKGARWTP